MAYQQVLSVLADPTRRRLFERLDRREHTVGELAKSLRITQPAVSQHLQHLRKAKLVTWRAAGTRRYYRANREGLADLRRYIESFWAGALAAFAAGDPAPPSKGKSK